MNLDPERPKTPFLPFAAGDLDRSGIRLTRAEFARFLDCSKQAVTGWVKSGKVTIGADGRLDPRQAVAQLLRHSDPARLRSRVLKPMVDELATLRRRIDVLEHGLADALEESEFHESSAASANAAIRHLRAEIVTRWDELRQLDADALSIQLAGLIDVTLATGGRQNRTICDPVMAELDREITNLLSDAMGISQHPRAPGIYGGEGVGAQLAQGEAHDND